MCPRCLMTMQLTKHKKTVIVFPWGVPKQPVHLTRAKTIQWQTAKFHPQDPSVEVTHISLYFKLNVRCKSYQNIWVSPLNMYQIKPSPLENQHVGYTWCFLHVSHSSQSLALPLQVPHLEAERQGDFKVGLCLCLQQDYTRIPVVLNQSHSATQS